ncbi:hypothetical protein E2C01_003588 [Portunus trituberculatus]|uniref:Uncharacterized protein n=1 Tax=Portunus trituberculatus TaxID=210409 RepID=A0A5B7CQJ6_PORTR|nr:hypothetical protein [Portunus trituberculatus]
MKGDVALYLQALYYLLTRWLASLVLTFSSSGLNDSASCQDKAYAVPGSDKLHMLLDEKPSGDTADKANKICVSHQ